MPFDLLGVPAIDEFVGRQDELDSLWAVLQPGCSPIRKIVILHGLGGIGKTQLAIRFARMHKDDYSAIFWFNARDRGRLSQSLESAFLRVTEEKYPSLISAKDEMNSSAQDMLDWLAKERNSRWLLIYDNVDQSPLQDGDNAQGEAYDISEFIPTADHGSIIITTRITHLLELGQDYTVQRLGQEDARHLLFRSAGYSREAEDDVKIDPGSSPFPYYCRIGLILPIEIDELGCRLDGLPLAITLAGSYMRQTGMSVGQYLKHYQTSWSKLMAYSTPSRHYPSGNILTTWTVNYEAVQKTHPNSAELLLLLAVFYSRDIWFELIQGCSQAWDLPGWFHQVASDHLSFMAAMKPLIGFSLVETKLDQGSYSMHPVLQDWCLHSIIKKCESNYSDGLKTMALVSLGNTLPLLCETEKSRLQQRLLPHADRMLHLLRTWRVPEKPEIYLAVHDIGCLYLSQGQLRRAEESYQRALEGKENLLGPDDTSTLETVNNLGLVYTNLGKQQDAEQMCLRALHGRERVLGISHVSTLESVNNLGFLYTRKGNVPEAERLYKEALVGYQKTLGPSNTLTLDTINNLGLLYAKCGKLKQAGDMYKQAIEGFEKLLGPNHTSTLIVANNLADIYCSEGEILAAHSLYERALTGYKKVFGPDHKSTLMIAGNLANLSKAQARLSSTETISSPDQTVSRKTKRGPVSGSRNFHGLGKVSYGRQDMTGWWICCSCHNQNSPDLVTGDCGSCNHERCNRCRLFY